MRPHWSDAGAAAVLGSVSRGSSRSAAPHGASGRCRQLAVNGVLTFDIATSEGKTVLRASYRVSGAPSAGLEALAAPVDRVIGEQVGRLVAFVEGRPPRGKAGGQRCLGGSEAAWPGAAEAQARQPKMMARLTAATGQR